MELKGKSNGKKREKATELKKVTEFKRKNDRIKRKK